MGEPSATPLFIEVETQVEEVTYTVMDIELCQGRVEEMTPPQDYMTFKVIMIQEVVCEDFLLTFLLICSRCWGVH